MFYQLIPIDNYVRDYKSSQIYPCPLVQERSMVIDLYVYQNDQHMQSLQIIQES